MLALIIGGSGSGKSAFAERLSAAAGPGGFYLATMEPFGEEGRARIARHRAQRGALGFLTVERYTDLAGAQIPPGADVLLEDLSNLLANEMFSPKGSAAAARKTGDAVISGCDEETGERGGRSPVPGAARGEGPTFQAEMTKWEKSPVPGAARGEEAADPALDAVRRGIDSLAGKCRNLTIVTNEVFSGGSRYEGETLLFLKNLAVLNRETALRADLVVEVVCGIPNVLKGELPSRPGSVHE